MEHLIDVLEVVAVALVAWRQGQLARGVAKNEARYAITVGLYEKARRTLNEHIQAPIHRR